MNVLLMSMPDSSWNLPWIALRMPNGALATLAGNIDPHHNVAVADLLVVQRNVRASVEQLIRDHQPEVVGLSVMTFQRKTAKKIISLVRSLKPDVRVVVGGYDPSMAPEAYTDLSEVAADFIVRGEGEITLNELLRALERGEGFEHILGLSYREGETFRHNPKREVVRLAEGTLRLPNRKARVYNDFKLFGVPVDVIETSRGCTFDCGFCSIVTMRGRNFHMFPIERVIADIRDSHKHGARFIFMVDDNITLNIKRFRQLCEAIIEAKLNHIAYIVQATTAAIANNGDWLPSLMRRAGFRYVFLGIENILEGDLDYLGASTKNTFREDGQIKGNAAKRAVDLIHQQGMYVIGGMIVGNPEDTRESMDINLAFARKYVDVPYIHHPTPFPGTRIEKDFRERGLITNEHLEDYDGTSAVVRSLHLSADDLEYLRWRTERWIKFRHFLQISRTNTGFVLRHFPDLVGEVFRGNTLKTVLKLEDDRKAFERFRAVRQMERDYL